MPAIQTASVGQFELDVELDVSPDRAWRALTEDIDAWWLPDFRATGERSVVRLDARAGGALVETAPDGTELVWYHVQMVKPGSTLYLVGHTAPDWGGPSVSMLKLVVSAREGGARLSISDSILGRVDDTQVATLTEGWRALFGKGLKRHVETLARS